MAMNGAGEVLDVVERAMVAVRRSQSRRTLARLAEIQRGPRQDSAAGYRPGSAVTGSGFDVLDVVEAGEQAGSPIGVTGVATALGIDQPRASRLVAAAVATGLVRREADQADGRRTFLVRTDAGRAASEDVRQFRRAVFADVMSDWSDADRADFARLLSRFVAGLGRVAR